MEDIEFDVADALIEAQAKRIAELEAAIQKHRRDVWGEEHPCEHPHDRELYAVLQKSEPK